MRSYIGVNSVVKHASKPFGLHLVKQCAPVSCVQVGNQLKRLAGVLRKIGQPRDMEETAEQKNGPDASKAAKSLAGEHKKRKDVSSKHQYPGPQIPAKAKKKQKVVSAAP